MRTLLKATAGDMDASGRYRDVFGPLGLGDESRAVLRIGGACWGYVCLHRAVGAPFSRDEVLYMHRLAPHLAEGIRAGVLVSSVELTDVAGAPALVVVAPDGSLASITEAGERWLEELGHPDPERRGLPVEVHALAARLRRPVATEAALPRLRIRTRAGRWARRQAAGKSFMPLAWTSGRRQRSSESISIEIGMPAKPALLRTPALLVEVRLPRRRKFALSA